MRWVKRGFIYGPDYRMPWAAHSALTPTPIFVEGIIRVFAGFRDSDGVSRIGFVDLDPENPSIVRNVSSNPALDVGEPGMFDDNGVILGDILQEENRLVLLYVGFQLVQKAKFLAFTGLAHSHDNGRTFTRVRKTPIIDRSAEGPFIRAAHTTIRHGNGWRIWYAAGAKWESLGDSPFPSYEIRHLYTESLTHTPDAGSLCLAPKGDEYRIGRPRVYTDGDGFKMYFTAGTKHGTYLPGFARSADGIAWKRDDRAVGIAPSETGWDSGMLCYTTLIQVGGRSFMFYNGNGMGRDGFGYAELATS